MQKVCHHQTRQSAHTLSLIHIYGANAHLRGTASGRLGYESYNQLGYVANNIGIGQNVARTLEYAYNDWAIYTLGKKLGKPESEIDISPRKLLAPGAEAIKATVREKIELFGSANKA